MEPPETIIPYAPIRKHAVIGDRRTAALVAADGTIDWMCLPDYGGEPVFAALLDAQRGGYFRFGPRARAWGTQRYLDGAAVVETRYPVAGGELVAQDAMPLPDDVRPEATAGHRVILRRLSSTASRVACLLDLRPRTEDVHLFCSHAPSGVRGPFEFELAPGEEAWAVLSYGDQRPWTPDRAREAMDDTVARWRRWTGRLRFEGRRRERVLQSLLVIRLLGFAPTGSLVAAPTTSLPERIGGDWNADYRLAWVRDGSLSLQALARHGDAAAAQRYFDWLIGLRAPKDGPLQVLYGVDGAPEHRTQDRRDFEGYRHSAPVRFGNHAYRQKQLGMFGFLADCASSYREHGGTWRDEYFDLIARAADHCAAHWSEADNGIWELAERRHRVSSRVGSWVALDRAAKLAEATGCGGRAAPWHEAMRAIRDEVLGRGYSERLGAFREDLEGQSLDAANLLVPILRFLPGDDPRVVSTVDAIARDLTIDGWVHRFVPREAGAGTTLALGDFEGSFVLCTCWLASAYALGGRLDEAETVLDRVDEAAGPLGLLPEGIDARTGEFLGNYPLLFSHAEYVRAAVEIEHARARARG